MTEDIRIMPLTDGRYIDIMTEWMYDWWGRKENYSREAVERALAHSLNTDRLPRTYGMLLCGRLTGMYQFTYSDLFVRPDIYPWLANVYLDRAYRGRGLGRLLLGSVKQNARAAGLDELFLFTAHRGLYEKFGWEFAGEIETFLEPHVQRLYRLDTSGRAEGPAADPVSKAGKLVCDVPLKGSEKGAEHDLI